METQEQILSDIKQAILSVDAAADVLLFGSRARGDYEEESDWDVLILTNEEVNSILRNRFYSALITLEYKYAISIGTIIKTRIEWYSSLNTDLYINIHEDGIVL